MSRAGFTKPMVPKGRPSRPTMRQQLKALDAISFDELQDFLGETVHTAFRKGSDAPEANAIWRKIRAMQGEPWNDVVDWMIWALRISTNREKKR